MKRQLGLALPILIVGFAQLASATSKAPAADTTTPTWLPTSTIQTPLPWPSPDLAMTSGGRSLVVWVHSDVRTKLDASYRLAGAPGWPVPVELGWPNTDATPRVAIDGKGDAIVVEPGAALGQRGCKGPVLLGCLAEVAAAHPTLAA